MERTAAALDHDLDGYTEVTADEMFAEEVKQPKRSLNETSVLSSIQDIARYTSNAVLGSLNDDEVAEIALRAGLSGLGTAVYHLSANLTPVSPKEAFAHLRAHSITEKHRSRFTIVSRVIRLTRAVHARDVLEMIDASLDLLGSLKGTRFHDDTSVLVDAMSLFEKLLLVDPKGHFAIYEYSNVGTVAAKAVADHASALTSQHSIAA